MKSETTQKMLNALSLGLLTIPVVMWLIIMLPVYIGLSLIVNILDYDLNSPADTP